jgi:hypothetical protein
MFKNKLELKKKRSDYDDYSEAAEVEREVKEVLEEVKTIEGCEGAYWSIEHDPYDNYARYYWVFYRWETDEELEVRKKKAEQAQLNYKRNQYDKLKKELGL